MISSISSRSQSANSHSLRRFIRQKLEGVSKRPDHRNRTQTWAHRLGQIFWLSLKGARADQEGGRCSPDTGGKITAKKTANRRLRMRAAEPHRLSGLLTRDCGVSIPCCGDRHQMTGLGVD
jgi:hypothetical protein